MRRIGRCQLEPRGRDPRRGHDLAAAAGRPARPLRKRAAGVPDDPPVLEWLFPAPMGTRTVIGEVTMADIVTVPATCPSLRCGRM